MKSIFFMLVCAAITLPAILFPAGVSAAPARDPGAKFADTEGKEWLLAEVKGAGKNVVMDRKKFELDNMLGFFSVRFDEGKISGMAAPNRYSGPYTAGSNRALSIGTLASTKMLALKEPDGLNENGFFAFLSGVIRWDLADGKLELYSGKSGSETTLIFVQK